MFKARGVNSAAGTATATAEGIGKEGLRIHILTDNKVRKQGLFAEHELSIFIEQHEANVLFDIGQSTAIMPPYGCGSDQNSLYCFKPLPL